jgi:Fe-Mn family superoxide dismutase
MKSYEAKDFSSLLGMEGFSDALLKNHFELYQGYVKNVNALLQEFEAMGWENRRATPAFAELKRRFGWEWNGVRLHELYFGNLAKTPAPLPPGSRLAGLLADQFGGVEGWTREVEAMGGIRGIGWVVTYYDPASDRLLNVWINEHDQGHLSGAAPVVIMDVFEHAYMIDYGVKKADYVRAFLRHLDWKTAAERLDGVRSGGSGGEGGEKASGRRRRTR